MSCWRCEKDLPAGQVECDPTCTGEFIKGKNRKPIARVLMIEIPVDPAAVERDDPALRLAVSRFSAMLAQIIVNSGLADFVKRD